MANFDNLSNIDIDNKTQSPAPIQNKTKTSVNRWKISCEHFHYKRWISVIVSIILISIIITVPTVLVHKGKIKINKTATTTEIVTINTTEVPLSILITNTTKWKQDGITFFHQIDFDETSFDLNPMYIDDNETIYIAEISKHRIIEIKLNLKNFSIVVGGNEDGTDQLWLPTDIIVEKKSDSFIICDHGNRRIVRWSRQNATNGDIIISNIHCNGLAMDDNGYLYVSDWLKLEVRQWDIGINNKSIIVAGGNGLGNNSRQFFQPMFIFVDKDYSVYVVDKSNHRVMKWLKNAKEGIVVAGGNGDGNSLTQLSSPSGIVVDHLDNIYITDTNNDRVVRWIKGASEGTIVVGGNGEGNETNQLDNPSDLVFDKQGNLYVFDSVNHRIQKFYIESN